MKIKLSSRLRVPVISPKFSTDSYSLLKFSRVRRAEKIPLQLDTRGYRFFIQRPGNFHALYFPNFDLYNKTILLVGAGVGEACYEYLKAGAWFVICVENDWDRAVYLHRNYGADSRVGIVTQPFDLSMLNYKYDFMLMNIGGYEQAFVESLIPEDRTTVIPELSIPLKPTHILAHSQYLVDRLKECRFSQIKNCGGQPYNGYAWMTNELPEIKKEEDEFNRMEENEQERLATLRKKGIPA